jgi:hypothetical protein
MASMVSCSLLLDWNGYTGGADASGSNDRPVPPGPDTGGSRGDSGSRPPDSGSGNVGEAGASEGGGDEPGPVDEAGAIDVGMPQYNCNRNPGTCQGCCDPENEPDGSHICGGGTSTRACGLSGAKCAICASGQDCIDGGCVVAPPDAGVAPGSPCSNPSDPSGCPTSTCLPSGLGPPKACCLPLPPGQCGCVFPFIPGSLNCY